MSSDDADRNLYLTAELCLPLQGLHSHTPTLLNNFQPVLNQFSNSSGLTLGSGHPD